MIAIDYRDRRPIYEQLIENIEEMAARGFLRGGSQLPSVRQMAADLSINPNTIQRAYSELESRGVIYVVKGKGTFISDDLGPLLTKKKEGLFVELDGLVRRAQLLSVSEESFLERCRLGFSKLKGGNGS